MGENLKNLSIVLTSIIVSLLVVAMTLDTTKTPATIWFIVAGVTILIGSKYPIVYSISMVILLILTIVVAFTLATWFGFVIVGYYTWFLYREHNLPDYK